MPWRYEIQHGPDGETDYAWVHDDEGNFVCTTKTHYAIAIVERQNIVASEPSPENIEPKPEPLD